MRSASLKYYLVHIVSNMDLTASPSYQRTFLERRKNSELMGLWSKVWLQKLLFLRNQVLLSFVEEVERLFVNFAMQRVNTLYFIYCYIHWTFSLDLAKVILWALDSYSHDAPLNVAGPEISIKELAEEIASLLDLKGNVLYDLSYSDGPLKRTVSVEKLRRLWPEFQPTDFNTALKEILQDLKKWNTFELMNLCSLLFHVDSPLAKCMQEIRSRQVLKIQLNINF